MNTSKDQKYTHTTHTHTEHTRDKRNKSNRNLISNIIVTLIKFKMIQMDKIAFYSFKQNHLSFIICIHTVIEIIGHVFIVIHIK